MPALAGPASGRFAMENGHQTRSYMARSRPSRITIGRDAGRPASFSGGCGISGSSGTTQTHHRRRRDDDDPNKIFRLARDRACWCWPAGAANMGGGHGGAVVLVVGRVTFVSCIVCRAERPRDNFKRQRRSGVMVCVSVFVTHQEARGRFEWFHDSTKHPTSAPCASSRLLDDISQ